MLTKERRGADRQFVSYSTLGINQLGAVYEGLMSFTGFFATEDLFEIAQPVKKGKGRQAAAVESDDEDDPDADDGDDTDDGEGVAEAEDDDDFDDGTGGSDGRAEKDTDRDTDADPDEKSETKAEKGTWVIAQRLADSYPPEVFVREPGMHGAPGPRRKYAKGEFVYRMSGRDRQRSASYYTPEVLTRCVVKHSLAELLTDDMAAARLLTLTICEPALGSGAFVNEVVNQLAAEYLRRAQAEQGDVLDPEGYHLELQKVKAHLALNNAYGVDLNPTAVELAEVSVWLNVMHPGLAAPWFGLRLRRGNSLIGARRATYTTTQLPKGRWKDLSPHDRPLAQYPLGASIAEGEVHHFLLPAHGWAASADKKEAKELRPTDATRLRE